MNALNTQWDLMLTRPCRDGGRSITCWDIPGLIDIHCPEFWGFVFFTKDGESCPIPENEQKKLDLRVLYYAQYAYYEKKAQAGGVVRLSLCAKLIKGKMKK